MNKPRRDGSDALAEEQADVESAIRFLHARKFVLLTPEEFVEAVAKSMMERQQRDRRVPLIEAWDDVPEATREGWRVVAREILTNLALLSPDKREPGYVTHEDQAVPSNIPDDVGPPAPGEGEPEDGYPNPEVGMTC